MASIAGLLAAGGLVLRLRRPEVFSSGSIQLVLSVLSLPVFMMLALPALKRDPDRPGFAPNALDLFYAASVAVPLLSFMASSKARENFLQPQMLVLGLGVYLLARANRRRLGARMAVLLATLVSFAAGVEAFHGLAQWASGLEMKGFFFNINHFAMFLAMAVPLAWAVSRISKIKALRLSGYGLTALLVAAVGLSRCRTAYAALLLVGGASILSRLRARPSAARPGRTLRPSAARYGFILGVGAVVLVAALGVSFKQVSAAGRLLIWKVWLRTALDHPLTGVGHGNFQAVFGREQGRYFEAGHGTAVERLSAEAVVFAFNDYLEAAMETGLVGLLVLVPWWGLTLRAAGRAIGRGGSPPRSSAAGPEPLREGQLEAGAGGAVMIYMVLAFFYNPGRILPLAILFAGCLGWISDEGKPVPAGARTPARVSVLTFAAVSLAATLALFPAVGKRYGAERTWSKALRLERAGRTAEAAALSRAAYPGLKSDADFLDFHAGLLLDRAEAGEAAAVLNKARSFSSSPRLAEKRAEALLRTGDLEGAFLSAREANAVLPWRLTAKSLLAEICLKRGELRDAARWARLVLETPMKLRTDEGEKLKAGAFELWTRLRPISGDGGSPLWDLAATLPPEQRGGVIGALQDMGPRCGPFFDALRDADPEDRVCLASLLANMPDRDFRGLDAAYLLENIRLARLARRTVPLASAVPDDVFLEYVLPYLAADERPGDWRRDFYERFRETAASSPTIGEAVVRLNRDVFREYRLSFIERDVKTPVSNPGESIARGYVSCADAAVMLVDACRAVGIPARLVIGPRWPKARYGHAWIEVWNSGGWLHLTAYDPAQLGHSWLVGVIAQLIPPGGRRSIFAVQFRRTGLRPMAGREIAAIDVTEDYLK